MKKISYKEAVDAIADFYLKGALKLEKKIRKDDPEYDKECPLTHFPVVDHAEAIIFEMRHEFQHDIEHAIRRKAETLKLI